MTSRSVSRRPTWFAVLLVGGGAILAGTLLFGRAAPGAPGGHVTTLSSGLPAATPSGRGPIRIGAVFPLDGDAADLAGQELRGVRIAADMINADGGVGGREVALDVRALDSADDAPVVMSALKADGVSVVVGAYSSDLSIAASAAADAEGLVYWEAGAVADQLTGRGLPLVFRVGASGSDLGSNSARFAAAQLAPRLDLAAGRLRVAIVAADDPYARSVADAAARTAATTGTPIVARLTYNLSAPRWTPLMTALAASRPDVVILASHVPDGIAFRKAMLAAGLHVKALIGSTMAQCSPDFAGDLGTDAIGVFASDRPTGGFQPGALDPAARAVYDRFAGSWASLSATNPGAPGASGAAHGAGYGEGDGTPGDAEYTITGPAEPTGIVDGTVPTEEGISGFAAAWPLFHDVLPAAAAAGSIDATTVATAARAVDLPAGSLPNGAGLRFSADPATLGQNERAAAVIWQWQAVRAYTFVWPATYATGTIRFVPLPQ